MHAWLGRRTWDAGRARGRNGRCGGAPSRDLFHEYLDRASSFAKATEDKDARPSRAIVQPAHRQGIAADACVG